MTGNKASGPHIVIGPCSSLDFQVVQLLEKSHALMQELFAPEDNFYLDCDALCAPHIHMFSASHDGEVVGCAALVLYDKYGEVKSMFVSEAARGMGVGSLLMNALEQCAYVNGRTAMKLETGDALRAAVRLYERHGFVACAPFGSYHDTKTSVFMTKPLLNYS